MFEEKYFLAEAAKYYKKAAELPPQNQQYTTAYLSFVRLSRFF